LRCGRDAPTTAAGTAALRYAFSTTVHSGLDHAYAAAKILDDTTVRIVADHCRECYVGETGKSMEGLEVPRKDTCQNIAITLTNRLLSAIA
jgi:hypothetical protein